MMYAIAAVVLMSSGQAAGADCAGGVCRVSASGRAPAVASAPGVGAESGSCGGSRVRRLLQRPLFRGKLASFVRGRCR